MPKNLYKGYEGHVSRTDYKILLQEKDFAIINKAPRSHSDECTLSRGASGLMRPVHRLDFETQGLLILASEKNWEAYHELFKGAQIEKLYLAGATAADVPTGHIKGFIASRYRSSKKTSFIFDKDGFEAKRYRSVQEAEHIVEKSDFKSDFFSGHVYQVKLITGRRHQIRSFFSSFESPLVGDTLYGDEKSTKNLELVSFKISFVDPISKKEIVAQIDPNDLLKSS